MLIQPRKAGCTLLERSRADQVPNLGKTGVEAIVGGHNGHFMVGGQSRPQLVGCGEAAEATAKDQNARHVHQPPPTALNLTPPRLYTLTSPLGLPMRSGHEPLHEFGTLVVIVEA